MAIRIVRLPDIGEGVAHAEIVEWNVLVDDQLREDQVVAAVMTDKATVEIPAPCAGKVLSVGGKVGETLAVGAELFRMEVAESLGNSEPAGEGQLKSPTETRPSVEVQQLLQIPSSVKPKKIERDKPVAAPSVRQRSREAGVDLRQVNGSGPAGRITHADIDQFLAGQSVHATNSKTRTANLSVDKIPVIGLRRKISQRMTETMRHAVHFSYVEEVDVTDLEAFRGRLNGENPSKAKLTLLPFVIHALLKSVCDFPQFNAHYDDENEQIVQYGGLHVGIATQTPNGLTVPVLHHAETLDLWQMADEIKRLAIAVRESVATRGELSGSTITISSLGALGGLATTPVLNRPEVAILGINKQVMRPIWSNDRFVPRLMMNLSSSFDHRVIDGHDAARFIQRIKSFLEVPASLFV